MSRHKKWREMVVILTGIALLLVANWRWPHAVTLYLLLGAIGPLMLLLPFWLFWGVRSGLRLRTRTRWRVDTSAETLTVWKRGRCLDIPLGDIVVARFSTNFDLGASRFLADALGLFDVRGRRLVKLPNSTLGLPALLEVLGKRSVSVDRIQVNPPRVFDSFFD